jgi:enediyne biosynthesis protein E4
MTSNRVARAILGIVFIALLVAPLALKRLAARRTAERSNADARTSLARHGFHLEEVSQAAGIRFVHEAPELDPKLKPIMPEVASMGASV